jgi:arginine decarboxylase
MYRSAVYDQIPVLKATGTGRTTLSAFHEALVSLELSRYNLVRLSSVVPPNTSVDATGKAPVPEGHWGDRLFCVYAEWRAAGLGEEAWAGVGWVQRLDGRGGLFVEHEGSSEAYVQNQITLSLRDLVKGHEDEFTTGDRVLNGAVCTGEPVCSMVLAAYETAPWNGATR